MTNFESMAVPLANGTGNGPNAASNGDGYGTSRPYLTGDGYGANAAYKGTESNADRAYYTSATSGDGYGFGQLFCPEAHSTP